MANALSTVIKNVVVRHVRLFGQSDDTPVEADRTHGALRTIDDLHAMTHRGRVYDASHVVEGVADDNTLEFLVLTDDTSVAHIRALVATGGDAEFQVYEGPTVTDEGTSLSAINRNRRSSRAAKTQVWHTPTLSADGTELFDAFLPGGERRRATGAGGGFEEYVLASNTYYLFRATNRSGGNDTLGIHLTWYESGD